MKQLFVCEKPSQARDLATAISGGYEAKDGYYEGIDGKVYTNAFGHLVTCKMPNEINEDWGWKGNLDSLPFFIKNIPLKVIDDSGVKKQLKIIVKLIKDAGMVYISTDAGREGEHIFRKIYALSGVQKPLKRLWLQNMTNEGIKKAYQEAKDGVEYEGLALAGRLREESDLLVGLNATQLATRLSGSSKVLSLGRVQTPTLAMIVKRDKEIGGFTKLTHYSIAAKADRDINFELVLEKDETLNKEQAASILESLIKRESYQVESKEEKEKPKKLFDLTELQKHMNKTMKWSADKTLKVTQALYEKKYVTYPRTSSQYLASDSELPQILTAHSQNNIVSKVIEQGYAIEKSFINPGKVTDHEAIIITTKVPGELSQDEKALYHTIFVRFIAAYYPAAIKGVTTASFKDQDYTFQSKETVLKELGWRELVGDKVQENILPSIELKDIGDYSIIEKETKPPQRYSEASLLTDMKNAGKFLEDKEDKKLMKEVEGIGTPATRSSIIEILVKRGFIEKKKNNIISTKLGQELIEMMPKDFSLYSARLTAFFETLLLEIEQGSIDEAAFYQKLERLIKGISTEIRSHIKPISSAATEKEEIAACPKCGKPIYENAKSYYCSGYKEGCKVSLWKNGVEKYGKKNITKTEAKKLLSGKVIKMKLKSKAGKSYEKEASFNVEKCWIELKF